MTKLSVLHPSLGVMVATAILFCSANPVAAQDYEIWAMDQGTNTLHIYNSKLEEAGRVDMGAQGFKVPHMIDFTSDYAYAVIAHPSSGNVAVFRTSDRKIIATLATGPGTHMATVKPDDSGILVAVIGDAKVAKDGKVVEITIDRNTESFQIGRSLVIADDPLVKNAGDKFPDVGAVCQEFTADGRFAYITLGPALKDGGLVVLDTMSFKLVAAYPPDQIKVNCGTLLTPDGKHMFANGGSADVGVWYAFDTATHKQVRQGESRGKDAHGIWATPDGREIWMVNRVSSNGIVVDAKTLEVVADLTEVGTTPDILAMSPDSKLAFVTLRGPNPVTAAHVAKGKTPGFAVIDVAERKLIKIIQPAAGSDKSDFHGIGVRVLNP
jgi:DNA-binding beta-propeller fold protein YncE